MNTFNDRSQITQDADVILRHCDLLTPANCIIIDNIVYEQLEQRQCEDTQLLSLKYRFFFNTDDYDYVEEQAMIDALDTIFSVLRK